MEVFFKLIGSGEAILPVRELTKSSLEENERILESG